MSRVRSPSPAPLRAVSRVPATCRRLPPGRASPPGGASHVSTQRTANCIFCRRTSPLKSVTAAVQLACAECGPYEVTVGVIGLLRDDPAAKAAVRAEIRHQLHSGGERTHVNLEVV